MGRMGCAPRMDRASSLLGTEVYALNNNPRPNMTVDSNPIDASTASAELGRRENDGLVTRSALLFQSLERCKRIFGRGRQRSRENSDDGFAFVEQRTAGQARIVVTADDQLRDMSVAADRHSAYTSDVSGNQQRRVARVAGGKAYGHC